MTLSLSASWLALPPGWFNWNVFAPPSCMISCNCTFSLVSGDIFWAVQLLYHNIIQNTNEVFSTCIKQFSLCISHIDYISVKKQNYKCSSIMSKERRTLWISYFSLGKKGWLYISLIPFLTFLISCSDLTTSEIPKLKKTSSSNDKILVWLVVYKHLQLWFLKK